MEIMVGNTIRSGARTRFGAARRAGFTRKELLVVVGVLFILLTVLLVPALGKARAKSLRIQCVSTLKDNGLGYRIFATENGDRSPWQTFTNKTGAPEILASEDILKYYLTASNELSSPRILVCPADTRKPAADWKSVTRNHISYFLNLESDETLPQSFLTGDRNLVINGQRPKSGVVRIPSTASVGFDGRMHGFQGNVVMGDGSVHQLSVARLREQFKQAGVSNMTLAVP